MMAKKLKKFTVGGKLNLTVGVEINAESLEDALAQARRLKAKDFVEINGEWMDGDLENINSVWEND
jgi:hypothetical protein